MIVLQWRPTDKTLSGFKSNSLERASDLSCFHDRMHATETPARYQHEEKNESLTEAVNYVYLLLLKANCHFYFNHKQE